MSIDFSFLIMMLKYWMVRNHFLKIVAKCCLTLRKVRLHKSMQTNDKAGLVVNESEPAFDKLCPRRFGLEKL